MIIVGQRQMLATLGMMTSIQLATFTYSTGKQSASRQPDKFKEGLQDFYNNLPTDRQQLRCMLLDALFPEVLVTGELMHVCDCIYVRWSYA